MSGLSLNKHGFWVPEQPLRFRNMQECVGYMAGKITAAELPQPGSEEYENAPFEQGFMANPKFFAP